MRALVANDVAIADGQAQYTPICYADGGIVDDCIVYKRSDTELLIWHDSPLECLVRVLTGEPQMSTLEQKRGAQVSFGEDLRLQWLAPMESEPSLKSITDLFIPAAPFT